MDKKSSTPMGRKIPVPAKPRKNSKSPKTANPSMERAMPKAIDCLISDGCEFLEKKAIAAYPQKNIAALREMKQADSFPSTPNKKNSTSGKNNKNIDKIMDDPNVI